MPLTNSSSGEVDSPGSSGSCSSEEEGALSPAAPNPHEALDFDEDDEDEVKSPVEIPNDQKDGSSDGEVLSEEEEESPPPPQKEQEQVKKKMEVVENDDDDDGELVDDDEETPETGQQDVEDGECENNTAKIQDTRDSDSVEEGEVTDEEVISEIDRKDNKPVCRFFSKGTCTWGNNCRFLHPGVTDKGLYSMFETPPPPPPPHAMKQPLLGPGPISQQSDSMMGPPAHESAWERGLRHAKEIIRASAKRKQTDVDFEEKKINLSLAGDEDEEVDDKENTHYVRKPDLEEKKRLVDDDFPIDEQEIISARAEFSRNKIDPEFVRERVHRVKPGNPRTLDHGHRSHDDGGRSPPPRRMVRESELRKLEIEMMMGDNDRKRPPPGSSTDPYGRNIPRQAPRNRPQRQFNKPRDRNSRSRSSGSSDSSTGSSSSSRSSSSRRRSRRARYYSRDSEDSQRVNKRKREERTDSSGSGSSGSRRVRRRRTTVSSDSTSRSRSKSGDRRKRRSSSRSSSSSREGDRGEGNGKRRFVRKAPPREGDAGGGQAGGGRNQPRGVRIAPPLPHFDGEQQSAPPYHHHAGPPTSRWAPPTGPYRRAPPPRAPRYFQAQQHETRPIGLVRERDLMHQGPLPQQPQSQPPVLEIEDPPSSPKDKTPIASPSGSPTGSPRRTKTRYKREYSSERVSRSRSRSYSNSRSRSGSGSIKRSRSRGSSTTFSRSRSRSRSNTPINRQQGAPPPGLRKAPPPPDSPSPPPRSPSPQQQQQQKPKQNQIKLTLKHNAVRTPANKHVLQRLGGLPEEDDENGARAQHSDNDDGIASTPASPPSNPEDTPVASTRREELLKQLKAVEEAIAKKRSKLDTK